MEKVILITTRELAKIVGRINKNDWEIVSNEIDTKNLNVQLLLYKPGTLFYHAVDNVTNGKLDKDKSDYEKNDLIDKIFEKETDTSKNLEDVLSSDYWWKKYNDNNWANELIQVAKKFFGRRADVYSGSSTEHWDKIYKIKHRDNKYKDNYLYISHEYNKIEDNKSVISAYLNAIISDILNDLSPNTPDKWVFINHDKDWQFKFSSGNVSEERIPLNKIHDEYKNGELKKILKSDKAVVFAFQHNKTGTVNSKVIEGFNEDVFTKLFDSDEDTLLDYLEHTIEIKKDKNSESEFYPLGKGKFYHKFAFPE